MHTEINNQNTVATQRWVHGGALNTTAWGQQQCAKRHAPRKSAQININRQNICSVGLQNARASLPASDFAWRFCYQGNNRGNGGVLLAFYHFLVEKRDLTSLLEWNSHTVMLIVCVWWWRSNKFVLVLRIIIYLFNFRYLMFKSRQGSAPADPTSWAALAKIPSS